MTTTTTPIPPAKDDPCVWFGVLQRAIETRDWKRASEAEAELRRLGVEVRHLRLPALAVEVGQ